MNSLKTGFLKRSYILHACVLSFYLITSFDLAAQEDGYKLFRGNCASCHKVDAKLIGPALGGVRDRWESEENLIAWIKNSQQYLADNPGDDYAQNLYEEYNQSVMSSFTNLSDEQVLAILDWIDNPVEPGQETAGGGDGAPVPPSAPQKDYTFVWLIAFVVIFLIVVKVLLDVKSSVKGLLLEVKGADEFAKMDEVDDLQLSSREKFNNWLGKNKVLVALAGVVVLVFALNVLWEGLIGIGVYDGYAPTQPIKFSHKIHAGDNEINCVYCHSSAEKGKHSGIPSVNVCMNCHRGIQEGGQWGTEEISKIYEAAGWNPETGEYDRPSKPIEWVRIHNLPDHVYFNHSQHVVVGEIECQTCHGEVETYDYPMKQYAELTMGWCINCHRETQVQMNGNAYYDKLHAELVEKYKDEGLEKFTVSQMGGLECAKCHY